jgi:hypothetical protein
MVRPIDKATITLSSEEVTMRGGREVLVEVDDNSLLIIGDLQGISVEQLRSRQTHLLNITIN